MARPSTITKSNYFEIIGVNIFLSEDMAKYIKEKYPKPVLGPIYDYVQDKTSAHTKKEDKASLNYRVSLAIRKMNKRQLKDLLGSWDDRYKSQAYTLFLENILKIISEQIQMDNMEFIVGPGPIKNPTDIDIDTAPSVWEEMQPVIVENILWGINMFKDNVWGLLHKPAILDALPWFRKISETTLTEIEYLVKVENPVTFGHQFR